MPPSGKDILETLIELLEKQEEIKISHEILYLPEKGKEEI